MCGRVGELFLYNYPPSVVDVLIEPSFVRFPWTPSILGLPMQLHVPHFLGDEKPELSPLGFSAN